MWSVPSFVFNRSGGVQRKGLSCLLVLGLIQNGFSPVQGVLSVAGLTANGPRLAGDADDRVLAELEQLVWTPEHALTDREIDQFLVIARSVGTFSRALDCSSAVKQPSLHMSAAAASRDITLFHAMDALHASGYDLGRAMAALVPATGPTVCRDQMEEWSASEANLFEEAMGSFFFSFFLFSTLASLAPSVASEQRPSVSLFFFF